MVCLPVCVHVRMYICMCARVLLVGRSRWCPSPVCPLLTWSVLDAQAKHKIAALPLVANARRTQLNWAVSARRAAGLVWAQGNRKLPTTLHTRRTRCHAVRLLADYARNARPARVHPASTKRCFCFVARANIGEFAHNWSCSCTSAR